jgi:hypothetical protein
MKSWVCKDRYSCREREKYQHRAEVARLKKEIESLKEAP